MIIITAGEKYNDIDALACAVAYKNLCDIQGIDSKIVLPGALNESVSKSVRSWAYVLSQNMENSDGTEKYVIVDVSEPSHFSKFVDLQNVLEVYDHRWGFEDYWKEHLGDRAVIDPVGACATLIWEKYKALNLQSKIDKISANLLYTAIISNTLNQKAQITNERDRTALKELQDFVDLPKGWVKAYFDEVSKSVLENPIEAMKNDTKVVVIGSIEFTIIQIELWDGGTFINNYLPQIKDLLHNFGVTNTFLTVPSISEGKNYIVTFDDAVKTKLEKCISAVFTNEIGVTPALWLRKEIMRELPKL